MKPLEIRGPSVQKDGNPKHKEKDKTKDSRKDKEEKDRKEAREMRMGKEIDGNRKKDTDARERGVEDEETASGTPRVLVRAAKEMPNKMDVDESAPTAPLDVLAAFLPAQLRRNLAERLDVHELFPVQAALIPAIVRSHSVHRSGAYSSAAAATSLVPALVERGGAHHPLAHDFCVSAPTGSGKTLAYAAPVVAQLLGRRVRLLRALILVLTADLAAQVDGLLAALTEGTGLRYAALAAASAAATTMTPGSTNAADALADGVERSAEAEAARLVTGAPGAERFAVDLIVATPERLIQVFDELPPALRRAPLRHLEFLVIDEADQLIARPDWLDRIFADCYPWPPEPTETSAGGFRSQTPLPPVAYPALHAPPGDAATGPAPPWAGVVRPVPLHKLLFSATLTYQEPQQWAQLRLVNPHFFVPVRQGLFRIPATLHELRVTVPEGLKVLVLQAVIDKLDIRKCLCFANSHRTVKRLVQVLLQLGRRDVDYYTPGRSSALAAFRAAPSDAPRILVASDDLSRGIDIPGVDYVINYDAPAHTVRYVHRAGRTARGLREGTCVSLVDYTEDEAFERMVSVAHRAAGRRVRGLHVDMIAVRKQLPQLSAAVNALDGFAEAADTATAR